MTPGPASAELWGRLGRPFDLGDVVEALLGVPAVAAMALADISISTGDEADALLGSMPRLLRRLRMGSTQNSERSASGVRGPVLWAETIAARSSSLGNSTVYVCKVPGRDYDVIENRMLVDSLRAIASSGEHVHAGVGALGRSDAVSARAKANAEAATRYIGHRALAQVGALTRRSRRPWRSLGSGRNAAAYQPAVALLDKAADPVDLPRLLELSAPGTDVQHRFLMAAIDSLESGGIRVPPIRSEVGILIVGPFDYVHPHTGLTGDRNVGLLRGSDVVIAFDPTNSGLARVDRQQVGTRRLLAAATPADAGNLVKHLER